MNSTIDETMAAAERQLDRAKFSACWQAIGGCGDGGFERLVAGYSEGHRAYHVAEHIAECLAWLERATDLVERPAELAIALYFHDAVYDPRTGDNEERSAALFRELAAAACVPDDAISRIAALILSTASHGAATGDAALLSDIDLAILGAPPSRYARFERDVRHEYSIFEDELYGIGRAHVLRGLLARLRIFQTERFEARLEAQARENLGRALATLERR